jgi:hypothetical protein
MFSFIRATSVYEVYKFLILVYKVYKISIFVYKVYRFLLTVCWEPCILQK